VCLVNLQNLEAASISVEASGRSWLLRNCREDDGFSGTKIFFVRSCSSGGLLNSASRNSVEALGLGLVLKAVEKTIAVMCSEGFCGKGGACSKARERVSGWWSHC